jgi:hypothetical protein
LPRVGAVELPLSVVTDPVVDRTRGRDDGTDEEHERRGPEKGGAGLPREVEEDEAAREERELEKQDGFDVEHRHAGTPSVSGDRARDADRRAP